MKHKVINHSFLSFLSKAEEPHANQSNCLSHTGREDWAGPSLPVAAGLARNGWPEGFKQMKEVTDLLAHELKFASTKEEIVRDVEGQCPDVDAYLRGDPECMFHVKEEYTEKKIITMQISVAVHSGISPKIIYWRGAVAVAIANALETKGFSVNLLVDYSTGRSSPQMVSVVVPAKSAGQPLDLDRMAFLLAHPGSLRRLAFSIYEHQTDAERHLTEFFNGQGYGTPDDPKIPGSDIHFSIKACRASNLESAKSEYNRWMGNLSSSLLKLAEKAQTENW